MRSSAGDAASPSTPSARKSGGGGGRWEPRRARERRTHLGLGERVVRRRQEVAEQGAVVEDCLPHLDESQAVGLRQATSRAAGGPRSARPCTAAADVRSAASPNARDRRRLRVRERPGDRGLAEEDDWRRPRDSDLRKCLLCPRVEPAVRLLAQPRKAEPDRADRSLAVLGIRSIACDCAILRHERPRPAAEDDRRTGRDPEHDKDDGPAQRARPPASARRSPGRGSGSRASRAAGCGRASHQIRVCGQRRGPQPSSPPPWPGGGPPRGSVLQPPKPRTLRGRGLFAGKVRRVHRGATPAATAGSRRACGGRRRSSPCRREYGGRRRAGPSRLHPAPRPTSCTGAVDDPLLLGIENGCDPDAADTQSLALGALGDEGDGAGAARSALPTRSRRPACWSRPGRQKSSVFSPSFAVAAPHPARARD